MSADPFEMFDGAYVLGALSDDDRRAYEAHLADCDACTASLRELQGLPQALALVSPAALEDDHPPPRSLLPALQRRARRDRSRRRWIVGSLAAAAAACIVALAVVVAQPEHPSGNNPVAMQALSNAPISATADVKSVGWGTQISVVCRYYETVSRTRPYALVVVDRSGARQMLGTWNLLPDKVAQYESGTSWPRDQIAQVQITTPDGHTPLLSLRL
jgi:hypothetical protein